MSLDLGVMPNYLSSREFENARKYWRNKPAPGLTSMEESMVLYVEAEYGDDILLHQLKMEQSNRMPNLQNMDRQPEITWQMRTCLADFIMVAHSQLHLSSESFFLTISIIDRYCSRRVVAPSLYQLVGCCALWLASKFYDMKINQPSVKDLQQLCNNFYPKEKFFDLEIQLLEALNWDVGCPTVDIFLDYSISQSRRHVQGLQARNACDDFFISNHQMLRSIAYYLCETFMLHRSFLKYSLSIIASCASVLSMLILSCSTEISPLLPLPTMIENSCLNELLTLAETPSNYLRAKYSSDSNFPVASIVEKYFQRLLDQKRDENQYYSSPVTSDDQEINPHDQSMSGSNYEYASFTPNVSSQLYQDSESSFGPRTPISAIDLSNATYFSSATTSSTTIDMDMDSTPFTPRDLKNLIDHANNYVPDNLNLQQQVDYHQSYLNSNDPYQKFYLNTNSDMFTNTNSSNDSNAYNSNHQVQYIDELEDEYY